MLLSLAQFARWWKVSRFSLWWIYAVWWEASLHWTARGYNSIKFECFTLPHLVMNWFAIKQGIMFELWKIKDYRMEISIAGNRRNDIDNFVVNFLISHSDSNFSRMNSAQQTINFRFCWILLLLLENLFFAIVNSHTKNNVALREEKLKET